MLWLLAANRASGFDDTQSATTMAFQNSSISIQELSLGILRTNVRVPIIGLGTFRSYGILMGRLPIARLVLLSITFS